MGDYGKLLLFFVVSVKVMEGVFSDASFSGRCWKPSIRHVHQLLNPLLPLLLLCVNSGGISDDVSQIVPLARRYSSKDWKPIMC